VISKPEWKTMENWLHWDLNPWTFETSAAGFIPNPNRQLSPPNPVFGWLRVQGLINLKDCPVESGGYHAVPKFHKRFHEWSQENLQYKTQWCGRNFVDVPETDTMRNDVTKLSMRAGSVLIWNSQLPHGNYPNDSEDFRMVQYVKMTVADMDGQLHPPMFLEQWSDADWFPPSFQPTAKFLLFSQHVMNH